MKKLSVKTQILIGITLFSMFFGAGNLIFPPFLGLSAGKSAIPAFLGFAFSAIGLPILGVIAVARSGGLKALSQKAGNKFAAVFMMLVYLSIGPCLAIPRTASTSFEMAVTPFLGTGSNLVIIQIIYTIAFFAVALSLALHPTSLVDWIGKRLAPILLTLIAVLFVGCLIRADFAVGDAQQAYQTVPVVQGFIDGYQTMDAIAALVFGIVLTVNIRKKGVDDDQEVEKMTIRAGWIAAVCFLAVYGALLFIGMVHGSLDAQNGAQLLSEVAKSLFGQIGSIILAVIFFIACLNTCVSLICCCAEYFHEIVPKFTYGFWACFFAIVSAIIANAGLNMILSLSVPVLNCLYPVAIVFIILAFLPQWFQHGKYLYPLTVAFAAVFGIIYALDQIKVVIPGVTKAAEMLPMYTQGLGWVCPVIAGVVLGVILDLITGKKKA